MHAQATAESRLCKPEWQVVGLRGRENGCRMSKQVWDRGSEPDLLAHRDIIDWSSKTRPTGSDGLSRRSQGH